MQTITIASPTEAKKMPFTLPTGTLSSISNVISKKDNPQEWPWQLSIQTEASP